MVAKKTDEPSTTAMHTSYSIHAPKKLTDAHHLEKNLPGNLAYITDRMPGYVYWKDIHSTYMGCNHKVARAARLKKNTDIIGKTDYDFAWGKEFAAQFIAEDQKVMEEKITLSTEYQLPIQRKDGKHLFVRADKIPLYDETGAVIGVLAVALDITDQKIAEAQLMHEKENVENLSQIKTFFIRNMEHDIRTPIGGIYTIADTLAKQENDQEKKEYLHAIGQSAKNLLDYCNNLLDFSRHEAEMIPHIHKKFDIKKLMGDILSIELPAAKARRIELSLDYAEGVPSIVIGDPYRLERILINLLSNAIKFTPKGFVKITVKLPKERPHKDRVIIQFIIEDTGIGISEENQAVIYDSMQQLSSTNKGLYKGTGLGLTIVKQLLEELHGEVDIQSTLDKGTTFVCTIPFKRPLINEILYEHDPKI